MKYRLGLGLIVSMGLVLLSAGWKTAVANQTDYFVFLPLVQVSDYVPLTQTVVNGSFEDGWTDLPPTYGFLINQQPVGWQLTWMEPGAPLFESNDVAHGVPECIHKLQEQLPPDEWVGGPKALILDGTTTYKIFNSGASFGAELNQTLTGLPVGKRVKLIVPALAVLYGATDPYAAETSVWVNGVGGWKNWQEMGGDRVWYHHIITVTVPANGRLDVTVQVKSKWDAPVDFFVDDIQLLEG